jgi:uncharacterized membrane protein
LVLYHVGSVQPELIMALLVTGLVLFIGIHLLPTAPGWRTALANRWGEQRYKVLFSLVSFAGLALIVAGYGMAGAGPELFAPSPAAIALAPYAVTLSFILFAAGNLRTHLRRFVRHPMLLGLLIWALVHLYANGDTRSTVLFGAFVAYAACALVSVVRRHAVKSFTPTARHDVIAIVAGVGLALVVMTFHRTLFGVVVVPFGR